MINSHDLARLHARCFPWLAFCQVHELLVTHVLGAQLIWVDHVLTHQHAWLDLGTHVGYVVPYLSSVRQSVLVVQPALLQVSFRHCSERW